MKRYTILKVILIFIFSLFFAFIDLPTSVQEKFAPNIPEKIKNIKYNLGLDLSGGTQLTYKIDLSKVEESKKNSIIEGVEEVIGKRVNELGVNEPNIYTSTYGHETYIVVELAGIQDIEKAKQTVGKVIQLEFKEQKEKADESEIQNIKTQASETLNKILAGSDFATTGNELKTQNSQKVFFTDYTEFKYKDELVNTIQDAMDKLEVGKVYPQVLEGSNGQTFSESGIRDQTGLFLVKLNEKQVQEREIKHEKEVQAAHILIAYKGAERAPLTITATKEEALKKAQEVIEKLKASGDFTALAKEYSDDTSNKETGGVLTESIKQNSQYDPDFIAGALSLENDADYTLESIETAFGYHIIKANKVSPAYTEKKQENGYKLSYIFFSTMPDPWQATSLNGQYFESAMVEFNNLYQPYVTIKFNEEGGKMFEELTAKNIGKPLAIFVGGDLISAPRVQDKISGGQAQITGSFSLEEANNLARDLITGAIPAPILLTGQYNIGASIGQEALAVTFKAGVIGIIALMLYLIAFYRLPGVIASLALAIYIVLLTFLIKLSLPIIISSLLAAFIYVALLVKIIKNEEDALDKLVSFAISTFAFFFLIFLFSTSITLTLGGFAGIILSIGMAVDANILIFERMKEELRAGNPYSIALSNGFNRAWPSIRDSNSTTLITCAILMIFGSAIIRGFAFNLAAGVLVSMFTAISVSYLFLQLIKYTPLKESNFLLGLNKNHTKTNFKIMHFRKFFYGLSVASIVPGIIAIVIFGFNLGIDFTGGTLLELKFEKEVAIQDLSGEIKNINDQINQSINDAAQKKDFGTNPQIVLTNQSTHIIRLKPIDEETRVQIINSLKTKFGNLEELRFTSIGPTVGETLKQKAFTSLTIALLAIMAYIAFAFRKVPKSLGAGKFALAAIIALAHDLMCLLGVFVIIGHFVHDAQVDTLFITALLTLAGFSIHDTIVVFDRIRENLKIHKGAIDLEVLTNNSINETMVRSINTSFATVIPLIALYFIGSESIKYFVLALIIGITVGAYSSIFIASPLLLEFQKMKNRK